MKIIHPLFPKNIFWKCNIRILPFHASFTSEAGVIKSPAPHLEFPKGNFAEFILQHSHKRQELTALECFVSGYKITYAQLVDQSRRWSGYLKSLGIKKRDVVATILPNHPHFGPLFLGTASIGAALSPLNINFNAGEISKLLLTNKAKVLVATSELEDVVDKALKEIQRPIRHLSLGVSKKDLPNVVDILQEGSLPFADPVDLSGDEPLFLPFSSGTTGFPKAAAISHNAYIANVMQLLNPYHDLVPHDSFDGPQQIWQAMLPFFHIYGSCNIFSVGIAKGIKLLTMPQFNPDNFVATILSKKISFLHTVPTLLHFLLSKDELNSVQMGHIDTVLCGSAPVLPSAVKSLREKLDKDICFTEGYGITEAMVTHLGSRHTNRTGSNMQLLSNVESKIVDVNSENSLPANSPGEIWLRTPAKMLYYLGNPQETSKILTDDEWIRTGDIGFYDDEGFFSVIDRMKDVIKVKGFQVSPSEVEDVLKSHPAVLESSVIGVPDERQGEIPKAFVVLKSSVSENELKKLVEATLPTHKHLVGGVTFLDSLPKSQMGKVLKKELRLM